MKKAANKAVELTPMQSRFVDEYLVDLNASSAALRAGYSESNCRQQAARLLTKANIKAAIEQRVQLRAKRVSVDADYVLHRLTQIDQLDVLDILDDDGNMKQIRDWPKAWRTSISGLDIQEMMTGDIATVIRKIKWPDKLKNLDLIGRHVNVKAWDKEESDKTQPITITLVNPDGAS